MQSGLYDSQLYWALSCFNFCTGFISISAFASLIGIPVKLTGYAIGSIICAKTAKIKMYKSII